MTSDESIPETALTALAEFRRRQGQCEITGDEARILAETAASSFLAWSDGSARYLRDSIELIAEMTASSVPEIARAGGA
ncbi:MAG: hypothetical protein ABI882_20325, partial [Acidobacteriota bacterium]